jgi:NAD(P)-dependent dehydrogenase (short-subunit alcohol dehydrogenase family)
MTGGRLAGRRILIVGGANGIGLASAKLMIDAGAHVAVIDRSAEALARAASSLGTGLAAHVKADLIDAASCTSALVTAVGSLGGLDGMVNCAAADFEKPIEDVTDDDWDIVLDVNVKGTARMCRLAFPHLSASRAGTIVNIASGVGLVPLRNKAAYGASKAALIMYTKSLALEWAQHGIRANAICPGAVDTQMLRMSWHNAPDPEAVIEQIRRRYPLRRIAHPSEIAQAVVFLSSTESSYVTGTAFPVDGGRSMH